LSGKTSMGLSHDFAKSRACRRRGGAGCENVAPA
jgi:hypothetical protein